MKKSRFTESQIVAILKEGEAGLPVVQLSTPQGPIAPVVSKKLEQSPVSILVSKERGKLSGLNLDDFPLTTPLIAGYVLMHRADRNNCQSRDKWI